MMGVLGLMTSIPLGFTPVPITLQTLGVMLSGSILGARFGHSFKSHMRVLVVRL